MVSVEIYIKVNDVYKRLDLFSDEKISLTSSVQNINDLSKVFTEFTQSFTIPASKNNNQIFSYWNENSIINGFDQRIQYDTIIELNSIPFKKGKIQIEKVNERNNKAESYTITFYGKVKQIKDLFKEDKLSVLDYSSLNHTYTYSEIKNRINSTAYPDVCYPLIGNQHKYEYLTGTSYDITIGGSIDNSINYIDLFPAIPVKKVFEFIENKYSINFSGVFLNTVYFENLYLYCKNVEKQNVYTAPAIIDMESMTGISTTDINLTNNTYTPSYFFSDGTTLVDATLLIISISVTDTSIPYRLKVKKGNIVYHVFDNLTGNFVSDYIQIQPSEYNQTFYYEIESVLPLNFNAEFQIRKFNYGITFSQEFTVVNCAAQSTSSVINIKDYIPDFKIIDFFSGILKMFNLTITSVNDNTFKIEPLDFFYAFGKEYNIDKYVINDSIDIERTKLFKKLSFNYETSQNIINNYFRNTFNRGFDYGDLIYDNALSNESTTYEIKVPFENPMYERTSNFQTATLVDKDLKPYKPKLILMYNNGSQTLTTDIKLFNGSSYEGISRYNRFSNELQLNGGAASLNFNIEQSSWNVGSLAIYSLFENWYKNYIAQLYNIKSRVVKLKAILPINLISKIKLNDIILFKDKRYIINQYTADLTKGEVDFELITDFRPVQTQSTGVFTINELMTIDRYSQSVNITILLLNYVSYDVTYDTQEFLSNTSDDNFEFTIDENRTGDNALKQIRVRYYGSTGTIDKFINIIQTA